MFSNKLLIERLSDRFHKSEDEINNDIKGIFSEITSLILEGKVFYMRELGYIYLNNSSKLIFRSADIAFDASLDTVIGRDYEKRPYYETIFETIRHIVDNNGKVYIDDFGSFFYDDGYVGFQFDEHLDYLAEERADKINKRNCTLLTRRLSNRLRKGKNEVNNLINELFKKTILSLMNEKVFCLNDVGYLFVDKDAKLIFRSADIAFDESVNTVADGYEKKELYEVIVEGIGHIVENGEKVYIEYFGTFFYDDGYIKFEADEKLLYFVDKRFNVKKIVEEISKELDALYSQSEAEEYEEKSAKVVPLRDYADSKSPDINEADKELLGGVKSQKAKKDLSGRFNIIAVLGILVILIALAVMAVFFAYFDSDYGLYYNIGDKEIYEIVEEYFYSTGSKELFSYRLSSDMYYWEISKELYGDATFWPLICAYNGRYEIDEVVKSGSEIYYKKIYVPIMDSNSFSFNSLGDIKYFYNVLSKSFFTLHPVFVNAEKYNHALWVLKLSAYYDKKVFMRNSDLISSSVYSNVLKSNGDINGLYAQFGKYNKLSGNVFMSFIALLK